MGHGAWGMGHGASAKEGIGQRGHRPKRASAKEGIGQRGHRAYLTTLENRYIESLIFNGLFKFGALKLSKNTFIKTASHTAILLNFYKKTVFFKILERDNFYEHKKSGLCNRVSRYRVSQVYEVQL